MKLLILCKLRKKKERNVIGFINTLTMRIVLLTLRRHFLCDPHLLLWTHHRSKDQVFHLKWIEMNIRYLLPVWLAVTILCLVHDVGCPPMVLVPAMMMMGTQMMGMMTQQNFLRGLLLGLLIRELKQQHRRQGPEIHVINRDHHPPPPKLNVKCPIIEHHYQNDHGHRY